MVDNMLLMWTGMAGCTESHVDPISVDGGILSAAGFQLVTEYTPSMLYAIACPSHGWISQKRLKLGSCNFHHRVVFVG